MQKETEAKLTRMMHQRSDIKRIETELKELKRMLKEAQMDVMDELDTLGLTTFGTDVVTVSISTTEMPSVDAEHWEEVWTFLMEKGYHEVMRRQLNSTGWKELKNMGIDIPHVTTFESRTLNMRMKSN